MTTTAWIHLVCASCGQINRLPQERLTDNGKCGKCQALFFQGKPADLNGDQFARYLERNDIPVVVDFWADWCAPCKKMAPIFEQAARELEPKVRLAKFNTELFPTIANTYGILHIPTLILFEKGKEKKRFSGVMPLKQLLHEIRSALM